MTFSASGSGSVGGEPKHKFDLGVAYEDGGLGGELANLRRPGVAVALRLIADAAKGESGGYRVEGCRGDGDADHSGLAATTLKSLAVLFASG